MQPDELLETRKSPILTSNLLAEKAASRSQQTEEYKRNFAEVIDEDAASIDLIAGAYTEELQTNDVAVWIDPIDGLNAFADGDLEHVTNMIGITVAGRPLVGIIHKPFTNTKPNLARTYVGTTESGLFYIDHSRGDRTTSGPTYVAPFKSNRDEAVACSNGGHF